jgi:hypothetical protein
MNRSSIIVAILLVALLWNSGYSAPGEPAGEPTGVFLGLYIEQLGRKLDCYFTVEQAGDSSTPDVFSRRIATEASPKSASDLVDLLKSQLKGYDVSQSRDNPVVIHIAAVKARAIPDYWLDNKLDLTFVGSPNGLLATVLGLCTGAVPPTTFFTGSTPTMDVTTRVAVTGHALAARNALTDFMPLSRYSRMLWSATTTQNDGKQIANVSFGGSVEPNASLSEKLVAFSAGEDAFYRNKKSPEAIAAATEYIESQMKTEKPFQVRWAMFYLGKNGVSEAVPLLLKHLKYQYTTCGVLEESYPAALALSMMGKPGSAAALKEIATESDALRLKLLCRVVLLVEGQEAGAKTLEAEAAKLSEAKQQQAIRDALKAVADPKIEAAPVPATPEAPAKKS